MVKIRISYETPEELAEILKRLQPIGRVKQQDKGRINGLILSAVLIRNRLLKNSENGIIDSRYNESTAPVAGASSRAWENGLYSCFLRPFLLYRLLLYFFIFSLFLYLLVSAWRVMFGWMAR